MWTKLFQNLRGSSHVLRNSMAVFTQVKNPLTGKQEWAVQPDDYDYNMELSCTGFGDMLHDEERNQKYFAALRKTIAQMHSEGREVHVLDIGTGTGILSMMAVASGADTVTACEAFMPMANCAERILAANGVGDKVRLVKKRSTDLVIGKDMPRKANLLVAELLDTELIGEGAISIYNHAHDHLLTDDVICIPAKAVCYAQVVQSALAAQWNTMKIVADLDGDILLRPPTSVLQCKGEAAVHDVQLSQLHRTQFQPITRPVKIFEFDFNRKQSRETNRQCNLTLEALSPGATELVFYWWDIKMDVDGEILLSCAPYWAHSDYEKVSDLMPWRDHWMQAIYYIPKPIHLNNVCDQFVLDCNHDEYSFWFDVHSGQTAAEQHVARHACTCNLHIAYPRSRIGQINQGVRNKRFLGYLERCITKDSGLLCFGDGCLLGLAAAKMGAKTVFIHETQRFSKRFMESVVEHNKLENVHFIEQIDQLDEMQLSLLTHVFAEPYFLSAILPWDNFRFGKLLANIKEKLPAHVQIAPHSSTIWAVPVQFKDLHKIRLPVGQCEGFDLQLFDEMVVQSRSTLPGAKIEAQPLWEYPCIALAKPKEVLNVVFKNFESQTTNGTIEIEHDGNCNGIALWVDWNIDGGSSPKSIISTGPMETVVPGEHIKWEMFVRQGVQLYDRTHTVQQGKSSINWSIQFKPTSDAIIFDFIVNN